MNPETQFFRGLLELQYQQPVQLKLRKIALKIPWARGWPENKSAFWNAEAFMWGYKIDKSIRMLIGQELSSLKSGKNLDLGCGAYSYLPSVGLDLSEKMLQFNEQCSEKIQADLERPLPLKQNSFDSVTAVFVWNYVQKYAQLLREVQRILKKRGFLVVVLYAGRVNDWQRQKETTHYTAQQWQKILTQYFQVKWHEHQKLWFFWCRKE